MKTAELRTLTLPIRLAIDDATSMEAAEIILVKKNIVPSSPSGRLNLRRKKYVIQDLERLASRIFEDVEFHLQRGQPGCECIEPEQNEQTNHERPQVFIERGECRFLGLWRC